MRGRENLWNCREYFTAIPYSNESIYVYTVCISTIRCSIRNLFFNKVWYFKSFSAVEVPWTTPPIISGFILQGWKGALWQLTIIAWSCAAYFQFFMKQDSINFKLEQEAIEKIHHNEGKI